MQSLPQGDRVRHRLSNIDAGARTGECSVCGPVDVRLARKGHGPECMTVRRANRGSGTGYTIERRAARFGITPEAIMELELAAGGACAICGTSPGSTLAIDHDHRTGAVRGMLCTPCNLGLGYFKDDAARLRAAITYLSSAAL